MLRPRNNRTGGGARKTTVVPHTHKNTQEPQLLETMKRDKCICIYIQMNGVTTGWTVSDKALPPTRMHTEKRWRLCRKHSGVPRSRVSLPKPTQSQLQKDGGEELGPSLTSLHSPQKRYLLRFISLSFIAQGGRPLQPVTTSLFSVLLDRYTPQFPTY